MSDVDTLARTIYGEARGEPLEGKVAIANVVMNRALRGGWWGKTIEEVCRHPMQFSCWNQDDPNRLIIEQVSAMYPTPFLECMVVAQLAGMRLLKENTLNATHYHALGVSPKWAEGANRTITIGKHVFLNGVK